MSDVRGRIILVDDNLTNLNIGRKMLGEYYQVIPAPSAEKMFEVLERVIPDLILLDVEMPVMNGYEAIKKLKADQRYAAIPVIFLTANSDESGVEEGIRLGAADYAYKPIDAPLRDRIEAHFK